MRLIDADKLKRVVMSWENSFNAPGTYNRVRVITAINEAPTVDAEPIRHGYWFDEEVEEAGDFYTYTRCSVCGEYILYDAIGQIIETLYCPWCGAKMDEEIDDEID